MKLELENMNKEFLQQNRDKIDMKLQIINSLAEGMKRNEFIRMHAVDSMPNYYNITKIYNKLVAFTHGFSDIGFMIAVTKLEDNMVISSQSTSNVQRFFQELKIAPDDQQRVINFYKQSTNHQGSLIVTGGKLRNIDQTVSIFQKHRLSNGHNIMFIFTYYGISLMPEWENENSQTFAILEKEKVLAVKSDWKEIVDVEKVLQSLRNDANETIKQVLYHQDNRQVYKVYASPSQLNKDITYIYITPDKFVGNSMEGTLFQAVILYVILMGIGTIIAFFTARNVYKPIGNIVNTLDYYGEENGQDELSFIEDTAKAIREANEELKKALLKNRTPLKTKFLRELVNGLLHRTEIDRYILEYHLEYLKGPVTVVILEYLNEVELDDHYDKEARIRLRKQLLTILEEQLKKIIDCETFELNYKHDVVLIREDSQEKVRKALSSVLMGMNANSQLNMIAAIGRSQASVYEIENSFFEALNVLAYRSPIDKKVIITEEDIMHHQMKEKYFYPLDVEKDLIHYAIRGKKENVDVMLERIFYENFIKRKLEKAERIQFIFSISATIKRILEKLNTVEEDDSLCNYHIKEYPSDEELKKHIREVFNYINEKMNNETNKKDHDVVERMIDFIHNNYNMDISLEDVATHLNLSSGYVSTLFKNYSKDNYKNYLSQYRIQKAKEYLEEDHNIKIKELAGLVGCNNPNTFIRMFKKYEGISPGQYLESLVRNK